MKRKRSTSFFEKNERKVEISIDVIVHATEDKLKIFRALNEIFEIEEEQLELKETLGHFENPIILLNTVITKSHARNIIRKILEFLSSEQINELIDEIDERIIDSRFHMRLDKQELIKGNIIISEKDTVKIKIHTPIYNKKNKIKIFTEFFQELTRLNKNNKQN